MYVRDAIVHLEKVVGRAQGVTDLTVNFTLGRMYLRSGAADKAIQSLGRLLDQNPGSVQGRIALAQAYAANQDLKSAVSTLADIVEDEPRVAAALGQYQQQAGMNKEAVETYTKALELQPTSRELKVRRIVRVVRRQGLRACRGALRRSAESASAGSAVPAAAGERVECQWQSHERRSRFSRT
jgi:predicted Zn-dependent protease